MQLIGTIISDYKSILHAEIPLGGLTVLFGPNGAGKTNLIEALGAHDPLARAALSRSGGLDGARNARVGLVATFDVASSGTGPDAAALLDMIAAPWVIGMEPLDIPEGIGAYCGSCWWLDGGDLYADASRVSLTAAYGVIRKALMASVPEGLRDLASQFLDLLLDEPVLIVQEDFAVELSCDRQSAKGHNLMALSDALTGIPDGVFAHVLGPFREWTGRWPPLTLLTRGPSAGATQVPAGFGWISQRLGGIRVVAGDVDSVEAHLDSALVQTHDKFQHRPSDFDEGLDDEYCDVCLRADHGGRVDPAAYPPDNERIYDTDIPFPFQGSPKWLEEHDGWLRVRPSLRDALAIIEALTNERVPSFVTELGKVRLDIRPVQEWDASPARCRIMFDVDPGGPEPQRAEVQGWVGVVGFPPQVDRGVRHIPLADLGAGLRRWIAATVRQQADACAAADIATVTIEGAACRPRSDAYHLAAATNDAEPQILVVDEPEEHLHPLAQEVIAAWAVEQASQHHAVVVATHSPAFFALGPDQATICQVQRVGHETRVRSLPAVHGTEVVARARQLGFELGLGRDALAQLTRTVVVVEGDWDRRMLLFFYGPQLAGQRTLVVPLQGADELGGLADAAVIPALGVPVIAFLDEVRGSSSADLSALTGTLTKAERGLRDLAKALGDSLRIIRYEDPDVICALPEPAVRLAYPEARFPGWDELLAEWRAARASDATVHSFKRWALENMRLPRSQRMPPTFFRRVLECAGNSAPSSRFRAAVQQLIGHCSST